MVIGYLLIAVLAGISGFVSALMAGFGVLAAIGIYAAVGVASAIAMALGVQVMRSAIHLFENPGRAAERG